MEKNISSDGFLKRQRINAVFDKTENTKLIILSAEAGYGKTSALMLWSEKKSSQRVAFMDLATTGFEEVYHIIAAADSRQRTVFVLDNTELLSENQLVQIADRVKKSSSGHHFILSGRNPVHDSFLPLASVYQLAYMGNDTLKFNEDEISSLLKAKGQNLDEYTTMNILRDTDGNPLLLNALIFCLGETGGVYSSPVLEKAKRILFHYLENRLLKSLDPSTLSLLSELSLIGAASSELLLFATAQTDGVKALSEQAACNISVLTSIPKGHRESDKLYSLSPLFSELLENKRKQYLNETEGKRVCLRAGEWFEMKGNEIRALDCYLKAENFDNALPLLEAAAERNAVAANYYELESFYKAMPEEMIISSPILVSGMACLHSLNYRMNEAQNWYDKLIAMRKTIPKNDKEKHALLEEKIIYTSIVFPDFDSRKLIGLFVKTAKRVTAGEFRAPEGTFTGNLPSVLRGSKDFSRWSKNAAAMRRVMKPILSSIYPQQMPGLPELGVGETLYETNDLNRSLIEVTKAITEAEQRGSIEVLNAAYVLQARIMTAHGQFNAALSLYENAFKKAEAQCDKGILSNLKAYEIRLSLLAGDLPKAKSWLLCQAPDEKQAFRSLDRYKYLTKAKVFAAQGMFPNALELLGRLKQFYKDYNRPLDLMEACILEAIVLDRIGERDLSFESLAYALKTAEEYHFVRVFADEGEAAYRLLQKYGKTHGENENRFFRRVTEAAKDFGLLYPHYLSQKKKPRSQLTKSETAVLRLLERNMTNGEIADYLGVTQDAVKFHTKNIYAKLDVKNRAQAVSLAKENGML